MHKHKDTDILSRINKVNIKDVALERLKRFISSPTLQPGQRLPSERELAERLGIGRPSVREALKVLETIGLVESRVGDGTFLAPQSSTSLGRIIGLSLAKWGNSILEICQAREIIEVESAYRAAQQATQEDIQALTRALEQMEAPDISLTDHLIADMQFHRIIAQTTHNSIVCHITETLISLLEEVIHDAEITTLPIFNERLSAHRSILEALIQGNPQATADAMRIHLQNSTQLWQAIVALSSTSQT